jgi:hypothetical protein
MWVRCVIRDGIYRVLLPHNSVGLIRSGKDCFDLPLYPYNPDFFIWIRGLFTSRTFLVFLSVPTCVFSTYYFRTFTYKLLFSLIPILFRSFVRPIFVFHLTLTLTSKHCRHISDYNIKMDLQEVGWGGMQFISLAVDWARWWCLVNSVKFNAGNFLTSWVHVRLSGRALLHGVDWLVG